MVVSIHSYIYIYVYKRKHVQKLSKFKLYFSIQPWTRNETLFF